MARNRSRAVALGTQLALACPAAFTQTATDTFQVSITIADDCTISAQDLNFGSHVSLAAIIDVDSIIAFNCSVGTAYTVSLNQGVNGTRLMSDGTNTVDYELYTTALRVLAWGTTAGVDTVGGVGDGTDQDLTVYGRVPVQATPAPATFIDTVTATVAF